MKTIGEKIREYRLKNNMTQEKLASLLNVTFQSVSKWETGVASPDLSLIVPLTRIFRISADELLGIADKETDTQYEELQKAYDHTYKTEDFAERQRICELAVSEYPGDMYWLSNLAWVVSNRSFEYEDNEKYIAEQEKAIRLFDAVIRNCSDDVLRGNAICGITQLLGWRGRKEEGMKYVQMIPERTMISRDAVLENVLEGDELIRFKQKRIFSHLQGILWDLSLLPDIHTDCMRRITDVMFPDGNKLECWHNLYYAVRKEINRLMKNSPGAIPDRIFELLAEMKGYAEAYDRVVFDEPGIWRYTAPWFDHIEENTGEWLGNEGETMMQNFRTFLAEPQFDFIRENKNFQTI